MGLTIHYNISTTFSHHLLLYQLRIKTRVIPSYHIYMGRMEYCFGPTCNSNKQPSVLDLYMI